jgi:hypothetical protein
MVVVGAWPTIFPHLSSLFPNHSPTSFIEVDVPIDGKHDHALRHIRSVFKQEAASLMSDFEEHANALAELQSSDGCTATALAELQEGHGGIADTLDEWSRRIDTLMVAPEDVVNVVDHGIIIEHSVLEIASARDHLADELNLLLQHIQQFEVSSCREMTYFMLLYRYSFASCRLRTYTLSFC